MKTVIREVKAVGAALLAAVATFMVGSLLSVMLHLDIVKVVVGILSPYVAWRTYRRVRGRSLSN